MKINEVQDKVTVYDIHVPIDPKPAAASKQNERMINILNVKNDYDDDKSLVSTLTKVSCLPGTEQKSHPQKPVRAELITFGAELFNKLKDELNVTEPDNSANQIDSKSTLKSNQLEQAEPRRIEDIYNDIFKNAGHIKETIATFVDDARAPVRDVSKAKEKIHQKSLATSTPDWNAHTISKRKNDAKEKQNSIINTEVSISFTTIDTNTEGKKILGRVESIDTNESLFFIKKNSKDNSETDIEIYTETKRTETKQFIFNQLKLLQLEEDLKAVNFLQKKLVKLQSAAPQTRYFENVVRQEFEEVLERDKKSAGDTLETLSYSIDNKLSVDDAETKTFKRRKNIEKILNDISKPQAALHKLTKLALDDSFSPLSPENAVRHASKKLSQNSIEVLKTLQFDDESLSEGSVNACPPLKKTVFGETSYMRETKEIAITRNYENVIKQNKELMVETGKADKSVLINPAMQSTKLQANLITSSQVELDADSYSDSKSILDLEKFTSVLTVATKMSESESLHNPGTFSTENSHVPVEQQPAVLVFDHLNPLNNILLRPITYSKAHKYNPMKGDEKLCDTKQTHYIDQNSYQLNKNYTKSKTRDFEVRTVTVKQHGLTPKTLAQEADQGITSSTPYSVNTEKPKIDTDNVTKLSKEPLKKQISSNKFNAYTTKAKKRISSMSTVQHRYQRPVKVTPKSRTKRLNILSTPKTQFKVPEKLCSAHHSLQSQPQEKRKKLSTKRKTVSSKIKTWSKAKDQDPEQTEFVEQLVADYIGFFSGSENNYDFNNKLQDAKNVELQPKTEVVTVSSQSGLSFSSSNNLYHSTSNQSAMKGMPLQVSLHVESPPKVLVFDYLNSLNNVLLMPIDETKAHALNSVKTEETTCGVEHINSMGIHNKQLSTNNITNNVELQTMTIQQKRVMVVARSTSTQQDQKDSFPKSHPVNIEEQVTEIDTIKKKSEIILQDHCSSQSQTKISKDKTRIRSPSPVNDRHLTSIEITPKPKTKMQNISNSAKVRIKAPVESPLHTHEPVHGMMLMNDNPKNSDRNAPSLVIYGKALPRHKGSKVVQTKTAEQNTSDDAGDTNFKHDDHEKILPEDVTPELNLKRENSEISQSGVTFTLSKTVNPTKDVVSTWNTDYQAPHPPTKQDTPACSPDLKCTIGTMKPESGANVVAQIDMLPFMGSQECEWETSPTDTWSFRMLNGRLRLTARLAHRMHNLTRTRVRGDTPVLDISVTPAQYDKVDLVARLCARFTCASLRHLVSRAIRGKFCARDIPPLLRRCAAVVRVALKWKRVMYEAKVRLAYTLDNYGNLSLKVANIPLRSVWDVTMHIGLDSADATSVPCPRASSVNVLPVVSDVLVPAADVRRALAHTPDDWGNVPSTIWRIYKLLKHKKRDAAEEPIAEMT